MREKRGGFAAFNRQSPTKEDPALQTLFDYEQHYMELVKRYREEIEFINQLHDEHTQEVKNFYQNDLPEIQKKLSVEPIDEEVRREWLKHLESHISKSFEMSEHFIEALTTKKIEEFNKAMRDKIHGEVF